LVVMTGVLYHTATSALVVMIWLEHCRGGGIAWRPHCSLHSLFSNLWYDDNKKQCFDTVGLATGRASDL